MARPSELCNRLPNNVQTQALFCTEPDLGDPTTGPWLTPGRYPYKVSLIEKVDARHMTGPDFLENLTDSLLMGLGLWVGGIDHMQKKVRMNGFKQGGLEGLNEAVGKGSNKAHGVREHHVLAGI